MTVVYLVRTHVRPEAEPEWLRWQETEHVPQLLALDGYLGVQQFAEIGVAYSYLNVWRLARREAHGTPAYVEASLTPWFSRIRPSYDVEVDFSTEPSGVSLDESAPWRDRVGAVVIDRAAPATGASLLPDPAYDATLLASPGALAVVRMGRLVGDPAVTRSAASPVVMTYLENSAAGEDLPPAGAGVERRCYRPVADYRPAS